MAVEVLRKTGLFSEVLAVLRSYAHNKDISLACCGIIWSLVVHGMQESAAEALAPVAGEAFAHSCLRAPAGNV